MKAVRALGLQLGLPKPAVREACELADLTTATDRAAGTVHIDALHVAPPKAHWTPLKAPVPGLLVTGTLEPDRHARYLLRVPKDWNGRLVVAAASGVTGERTYDLYLSDWLLSRGYAFAATDKGVRSALVDDVILLPQTPESSVRRWAGRLEDLARAASAECEAARGRKPEHVYAAGLSNGGYVARKAAESSSGLFSGAVEVSGVLWRADAGGILRELPAALRAAKRPPFDEPALLKAGYPAFDAKWQPVVSWYRDMYWGAVLHLFLGDLDPDYQGRLEDYDLDGRPGARKAIEQFQNSGDLKVPLISIAGRQDWLIPCASHAEAYAQLVKRQGKGRLHELEVVEDAAHIDTNAELFPFISPLMPRLHAAFERLVARVEGPAPSLTSAQPRR
jgi:alpha-beta hydrolase superfamily lysophospholipase